MISASAAESVMGELRRRGLFELLESVCRQRGVMPEELYGGCRAQSVARARHELWWRIRALPDRDYSYPEIARMFGCDSSTVLHGVRAFQRRRLASVEQP